MERHGDAMKQPLFAVIGLRLSKREMEIVTPAIALALCSLKLQSIRWFEPSAFNGDKFGMHLELTYEENVRDPVATLTLKTEEAGLVVAYADKARYVPLALRNLTVEIPPGLDYLFWGNHDDHSHSLHEVLEAWFYFVNWPKVRKGISLALDALILENGEVTNFKFGHVTQLRNHVSTNLTVGTISGGKCYLTTFTRDPDDQFAFVITSIDSDTGEPAKLEIVTVLLDTKITLPYYVHLE